jgi:acyl-CoA reductase-like NAD-dependent aldehyde dehydrogenase
MRIAQEESRPVLATLTFKGEEEAPPSRTASSSARRRRVDARRAHYAPSRAALRAGTVYVNTYDADDITVPFGGFQRHGTRQVAAPRQVHGAQDT